METSQRDQGLDKYFKNMGDIELLSAEQEKELANIISDGRAAEAYLNNGFDGKNREQLETLVEEGKLAKEVFVVSNLRLVVSIAKKYQNRGVGLDDLIQEGNIGVMTAVDKFDPDKGFKFSTYATWWVRQAITRAIDNKSNTIRVPVHVNDDINNVHTSYSILQTKNQGTKPSIEEIAEEANLKVEKVIDLVAIDYKVGNPDSLNRPVNYDGDGETELHEFLEDADSIKEDGILRKIEQDKALAALMKLPELERNYLIERFGLFGGKEKNLSQLTSIFNVSSETLSRIERRAINMLRHPSFNLVE